MLINIALIPLFVWALRMPFTVLCALVLVLCIVGGFAPSQKMHDVWLIAGFGVVGYLLRKADYPMAPLVLALVLGPLMEKSFRQTLIAEQGNRAGICRTALVRDLHCLGARILPDAPDQIRPTGRAPGRPLRLNKTTNKRTVDMAATMKELLAGHPDEALALGAPDRNWLTYAGLRGLSRKVADQLHAAGIGRGDRVAIVLPNGPEMATAFVTVAQSAVTAPLNPAYREDEFAFYLEDLKAKALIVAAGL